MEAEGKDVGEPGGEDPVGGFGDVVFGAAKNNQAFFGDVECPGGTGIAVAGLTNGAGIDEIEGVWLESEFCALGGAADGGERASRGAENLEATLDMGVTEKGDRRFEIAD